VCKPPPVESVVEPEPALVERARGALARWRALYPRLRDAFQPEGDPR
jgi:hypothetical protein